MDTVVSENIFDEEGCIEVVWRNHDKGQIATVTLINKNVLKDPKDREERAMNSFFEVELKCILKKEIVFDYPSVDELLLTEEEKEIELRYKDEHVYSIGHGVAVDWRFNTQGDIEIYSDFLPMVEVPQVTTDVSNDIKNVLSFSFLSQIETNHLVLSELKDFIFKYDLWVIEQQKFAEENNQGDEKNTANRIVKKMLIAKHRMMRGINLLDRDKNLKKAFSFANKAMLIQMHCSFQKAVEDPDDRALKWRPFQLAFILMLIESSTDEDNEYRDVVDLIWFPTGGGKTEAYLGLMAFVFAYRRIRYPSSQRGTAAIMRYTLRLLTSQQFERACRVISALELIRQSDEASLGKVPFTIGLWIGGAISPNTFKQTIDKIENKQYDQLVLTHCPWCNHEFNRGSYICTEDNFHFTCLNAECDF